MSENKNKSGHVTAAKKNGGIPKGVPAGFFIYNADFHGDASFQPTTRNYQLQASTLAVAEETH